MQTISLLLLAHFIGDFVLQTDWQAQNKSRRWDALLAHVATYTAVLAAFAFPLASAWPLAFAFVLVNGAAHCLTDAVTSRITSRLWFFQREVGIWTLAPFMVPRDDRTIVNPWTPIEGTRHWFFVAIGADQLIHALTLLATAEWWL